MALTLRGARVHTLVCDKVMPACLRAQADNVLDPGVFSRYELPEKLCGSCYPIGEHVYGPLGLPHHRFSELLSPDEQRACRALADSTPYEAIPGAIVDGLPIGEQAYAGALRYFARGDLDDEPYGESVLRRYFEASLQAASVTRSLLATRRFEAACMHHGIYVPQGVSSAVARQLGVRVSTWNPAYRSNCFIFSLHDTYHHTLLDEPTESWDTMPWTAQMEEQILNYLKSRWSGSRDWIWFHDRPDEDFAKYAAEIGLDLGKPIVGMLSNVIWDAQLHYRANAFPTMLAWVIETIRYFERRPDLQLLLRVHPAELRGTARSRQPLVDEIARAFPTLPPNVFIIPPESQVSTYAAMAQANAVIIFGTKTGVELTSMGIPVIVAGEAWIRNKGLTLDASSAAGYFEILDGLPLAARMPAEQVARARKYAYHFFFRRMVPLEFMEVTGAWPPYRVALESLGDLLPGRHAGLDIICDGILNGSPFIYPAEELGVHDR
ncbi:MAG: capsular biosynthesis protein [Chloroflexi bacterium]|nr:capsular biosynthesis protein [Chloroflexota bacterium]